MIGLCIASQKGGVGKTTLALNLSYALARRGLRTVIVDVDPLGAVGLSLSKKVAQAPGLAEYANRLAPLRDLLIVTRVPELRILPVGRIAAEEAMAFHAALHDGLLLQRLATDLEADTDLVVFDTPSGFGGATMGAMRVAGYVICPVQAEPIAARSVLRIFDVVAALREQGAEARLLGLVITMLQPKLPQSMAIAEDLWKALPRTLFFETTVPRDGVFLEASGAGVPLGLLRRRPPPTAVVFDQLAAEVETRLGVALKEPADEPVALVD